MARNGLKWLEEAVNWLELAGNGWKGLEMIENGLTWLEMSENILK